jgi:hypothetical protein
VFTSELTAIFQPHKIPSSRKLSDSMSSSVALQSRLISTKTHLLIYEGKEAFWFLQIIGFGVSIGRQLHPKQLKPRSLQEFIDRFKYSGGNNLGKL